MGASSTLPVLPRMTPNEEVCEMRKRIEVERCAAMRSCSQREFSEHMSLPFVVHRAREEERRMVHGYVPPATGECGKRGAHWQSNESVGALLFDSVKARRQDKDRARVRDLKRVLTVERAKRAELERSVARLMRPRTESASAPMLVPRDPFKRFDMLGAMPSRKASRPNPHPRVCRARARTDHRLACASQTLTQTLGDSTGFTVANSRLPLHQSAAYRTPQIAGVAASVQFPNGAASSGSAARR